jgi:hypothetical protein
MNFLPIHKETLVSELPVRTIIQRLSNATDPISREESEKLLDFQGVLDEDRFRISQQIKHPNNYIPLIEGYVEPTKHGCLIFITYKLFFSSFLFLAFWSIMCLGLAIFLALSAENYFYSLLAFGLGVLNYVITLVNFRKQVDISHALLMNTLNID